MLQRLSLLILCTSLFGLCLTNSVSAVNAGAMDAKIDNYLKPLAETNNFSGSVMVFEGDSIVFSKSFGFAEREKQIPNRPDTRFHLASISMQFTAAAAMRLVEQGKLTLDTTVADIVQGLPNGERITVRQLLDQNSGLPDRNDLPDYDDFLKAHQTPESLVQAIRGKQPFAEPGGKSVREEHSAYDVLALIVEKKTGMPFALAVQKEVFVPLGMHNSGIDDDTPINNPMAIGYQLSGTYGLKPATPIHWSAKIGTGSAYSSVEDYRKWLTAFFADKLLSATSRAIMLDYGEIEEGYGWGKFVNPRFGELEYWSSGRAPGFSSSMIYLPKSKVAVVVLSNIENGLCPIMARDIALIAVSKPYEPFRFHRTVISAAQLQEMTGDFLFGPDFYRPNATLTLVTEGGDLILKWPGGPDAPLVPIDKNEFMDRYYGSRVTLAKGTSGSLDELHFGEFVGKRVPAQKH